MNATMTLLKHAERYRVSGCKSEVWQCFHPRSPDEHPGCHLGALVNLFEMRIPPGCRTRAGERGEAEILTYTHQGAIACRDAAGGSCVLRGGEFKVTSTGSHERHTVTNASRRDWAHVFCISLRPCPGLNDFPHDRQRFTSAQRRNRLLVVASPDGRSGSLRIHQDALIHSSELEPGHHLVHELLPGRSAWLQIICGEATLETATLTSGDVVGVLGEPTVSLTARVHTELLLVDVADSGDPSGRHAVVSALRR